MAWPINDGLIHHSTTSIRLLLKSQYNDDEYNDEINYDEKLNFKIMDTSPWAGYIGFVLDDGKCGLVFIPTDHIDNIFGEEQYKFIFIDINNATTIVINSRFQFITIGCQKFIK